MLWSHPISITAMRGFGAAFADDPEASAGSECSSSYFDWYIQILSCASHSAGVELAPSVFLLPVQRASYKAVSIQKTVLLYTCLHNL